MIIRISGKCDDKFSLRADDIEHEGYVPNIGIGGGDYINIEIDAETGQILNWKPITKERLIEILEE